MKVTQPVAAPVGPGAAAGSIQRSQMTYLGIMLRLYRAWDGSHGGSPRGQHLQPNKCHFPGDISWPPVAILRPSGSYFQPLQGHLQASLGPLSLCRASFGSFVAASPVLIWKLIKIRGPGFWFSRTACPLQAIESHLGPPGDSY